MKYSQLVRLILILIVLTIGCSNLYPACPGDTTLTKDKQELVNAYLTFHKIIWNLHNTPDSTISNFIIEVKEQILIKNKKEYVFFIEELGRILDGGVSEELSDAFSEIYEKKPKFIFDYIFKTFPQTNYLTDLLFENLSFEIEISNNPRKKLRKTEKFFIEAIKPYQEHKYHTKELNNKFKLFKERVIKDL